MTSPLIPGAGLPDADRLVADRAIAALQQAARRACVEDAAGRDAAPANDRAGLRQVARQFEAMFMNQLLKSMRATVPENELWGQDQGTKIYRQMHDEALAERMAGAGRGLGIAQMIERQFAGAVDGAAADPEAALPAPGPSLAAYRREPVADPQDDRLRGLRSLAGAMGGAAADTLGRWESQIAAAARATGVDPGLLLAVVVQESGGDPRAVSPRGARGLMQLMPATAREVGVRDPHDPAQGLLGGARYLGRMIERFAGRLDLALAAYNAGPGAVERAGGQIPEYAETRRYVARVRDLAVRLGVSGTELAR